MGQGAKIIGLGAVVALLIVMVAVVTSSEGDPGGPPPTVTFVEASEEPLPLPPELDPGAQDGGATPAAAPAPKPRPARRSAPKPTIVQMPIPFPRARRQQMAAYSERHYGERTARLSDPEVIVQHFTVTPSVEATYDVFAPNTPDPEFGELPGTCSHFVVGKDGTIHQFVPLDIRCRHTVGLNWTSIGIEHVGSSDREIMGNRAQLTASMRLTTWLRCRYEIANRNVIGHNENRSSRYHRENVAAMRNQTHGDFTKATMDTYRAKLRERRCA